MESQETRIDRFLQNKLTPEELEIFNEDLKKNKEMQLEIVLQKELIAGINRHAEKKMKSRISAIQDMVDQESKVIPIFRRKSFLIAASVAFIIGMLSVLNIFKADSTADLYTAYYSTYDWQVDRGNTADGIQNIILASQQGERSEVIRQYAALSSETASIPELQLIYGSALLEIGNLQEAEAIFKLVGESPLFTQESNWYLGLTALKAEQLEKAIDYISKAKKPTSTPIGKKAQELSSRF